MEEAYKQWHDLQVMLAKANINILKLELQERTDRDVVYVYYEFSYHPKPGKINWFKTVTIVAAGDYGMTQIGEKLLEDVLELRKELEN